MSAGFEVFFDALDAELVAYIEGGSSSTKDTVNGALEGKARDVAFVQEVGRILRTSPGKDCAILLDPRNLFEQLSLTYAEVLGWRDDSEVDRLADVEHSTGLVHGARYARQRLHALASIMRAVPVTPAVHDRCVVEDTQGEPCAAAAAGVDAACTSVDSDLAPALSTRCEKL